MKLYIGRPDENVLYVFLGTLTTLFHLYRWNIIKWNGKTGMHDEKVSIRKEEVVVV